MEVGGWGFLVVVMFLVDVIGLDEVGKEDLIIIIVRMGPSLEHGIARSFSWFKNVQHLLILRPEDVFMLFREVLVWA